MNDRPDRPNVDEPLPNPKAPRQKYRAPDFMRKEIALFYRARMLTRTLDRNGDNDRPIVPIRPLRAVRALRPLRGFDAAFDTEA
jgi:hypothetical protein